MREACRAGRKDSRRGPEWLHSRYPLKREIVATVDELNRMKSGASGTCPPAKGRDSSTSKGEEQGYRCIQQWPYFHWGDLPPAEFVSTRHVAASLP